MPHPKELIEKIAEDLRKSYPDDAYKYVIEQGYKLKTRKMQPDIQVFDNEENLLCCVEIGYTRPEKLKQYHADGVPDVRWYSKAGELIDLNVKRERVIVEQEILKVLPSSLARSEVLCFEWYRDFPCSHGEEEGSAIAECPSARHAEHLPDEHYLLGFMSDRKWKDIEDWRLENPALWETDGIAFASPSFLLIVGRCDICGQVFYSSGGDAVFYGSSGLIVEPGFGRPQYSPLDSFECFQKYWDRLHRIGEDNPGRTSFSLIKECIKAEFDFDFPLEELKCPTGWNE